MTIKTVTYINGTNRSGKTYVASLFNKLSNTFIIDEDTVRTKAELIKQLNDWKASGCEHNVVLIGSIIYTLIDYNFNEVPQYYVSCDAKLPFVLPKDEKGEPLFK